MKIKKLDFYFPPLQIVKSLSVESNVSGCQVYDLDFNVYVPDYSVAYLTLQPVVDVYDKAGIIPSGRANANLSNVCWKMYREDTGWTTLDKVGNETQRTGWEVSPGWEVCISGDDKGRLLLKSNIADPMMPATLQFTAKYADTRTSEVLPIEMTYLLVCDSTTSGKPLLRLDASPATLYNPLRSEDKQTVKATMYVGDRECLASKRRFVWRVKENNTWMVVGSQNTHYYLSVNAEGDAVTIDRTLMGDRCDIKCIALYSPTVNPSSLTEDGTHPEETVSVIRRIPAIDYDIVMADRLLPDTAAFVPGLTVKDAMGDIPESCVGKVFDITWSMATDKEVSTNLSYKKIGDGLNPLLDTQKMSRLWGGVLAVDVTDHGALSAATDYDNALLTVTSDTEGEENEILLI